MPPVLGIVVLEQGCPLHDLAGPDHAGDVLGMLQDTDVVERIALDQDEVGPLARGERPRAVLHADGLSRHPRGGHEDCRWREAILREQYQHRRSRESRRFSSHMSPCSIAASHDRLTLLHWRGPCRA
jgi:hypothetical protein